MKHSKVHESVSNVRNGKSQAIFYDPLPFVKSFNEVYYIPSHVSNLLLSSMSPKFKVSESSPERDSPLTVRLIVNLLESHLFNPIFFLHFPPDDSARVQHSATNFVFFVRSVEIIGSKSVPKGMSFWRGEKQTCFFIASDFFSSLVFLWRTQRDRHRAICCFS